MSSKRVASEVVDPESGTLVRTKPRVERTRSLVTGGAGFVGSHLCDYLVQRGDHVICLDNFFTGTKENIAHLLTKGNFELIRHDVVNPILLEVDEIYHLACPASPVHYKYNPIKTTKTSFLGTMNILGLAKRTKAKIMLASTSEVYGDPLVHPQPETYWGNVNCIGERSCYDEGKRAAETMCMDYKREHDLDVKIIRIFNTYGPRMALDDGRVVSNFLAQALKNEPITIYGDGQQTRSFQYVSDLVAGIVLVMGTEHGDCGPYNVGNPGEFTMLELAEFVKQVTNSKSEISFQENTEDDPKQRKPDITKARTKLGWEPRVPLKRGLQLMIDDFKTRLGIETVRRAEKGANGRSANGVDILPSAAEGIAS